MTPTKYPDATGHFDIFGGSFVPEALRAALAELTEAFTHAQSDPEFATEVADLQVNYAGRPSPLTEAKRFSQHCGNATILLEEAIFERALSGALESITVRSSLR